ncbi:MAG: rod shape-determining protein RodA [Cytophagales bacterium]|nr:rod shape-determining protein RodA [Cytophagales bacterium]
MRRENSIWKNIDWLTIILFLTLAIMGWLNIYSAIYTPELDQSMFDFQYQPGKQFTWICFSVITISSILVIDFNFFFKVPYLFYIVILVAIVLVLSPLGVSVGGNRAWIDLKFMRFQPAEFAKLAVALSIAKFIDSTTKFRYGLNKDTMKVLGIIFFVPILILGVQKDTGSALVFACFIVVLFLDGLSFVIPLVGIVLAGIFVSSLLVNPVYLILGIIGFCQLFLFFFIKKVKSELWVWSLATALWVGALAFSQYIELNVLYLIAGEVTVVITMLVFFLLRDKSTLVVSTLCIALVLSSIPLSTDYILNDILQPHQKKRIEVMINPESDPKGVGWNVIQSKTAIGSGGLWGTGYQQGTFTKGDYVPEQHTDFIFCTIGEEHGWVGSITVITLFMILLIRLLLLTNRQRSRFAKIYGYSVFSILFFHFMINIGMVIGLLPVIGIPLPFFSYGGSSLWAFTIMIFIFIKLDMHRTQILARG